ncbi:MAG: hypothetical protein WDN49_25095 [Acetobacteraceae bacterium]
MCGFENTGIVPMRHAGTGRISIANEWRNPEGMLVPSDDLRTPLPLESAAGSGADAAGAHPAAGRDRAAHPVDQDGAGGRALAAAGIRPALDTPGAGRSHRSAAALAGQRQQARQLRRRPGPRRAALLRAWLAGFGPAPRLLELGGNAQPSSRASREKPTTWTWTCWACRSAA